MVFMKTTDELIQKELAQKSNEILEESYRHR
jgi:hypothetical protein